MPYATVEDVQDRIPSDLWGSVVADEQPSPSAIQGWLEANGNLIDGSLAWKYVVPVTNAADLTIVQQICALLTAADVWEMRGGYDKDQPNAAASMRASAYQRLAYDPKTGYSHLILPGGTLAETGEAEVMLPEGTFTDPDACGSAPRLFRVGQEF